MAEFIPALEKLIEQFQRMPGIGRKSAMRMAFNVLDYTDVQAENFAQAIIDANKKIVKCKKCFNLSESEFCPICLDQGRDHSVICVLEDARDVISMERVKEYNGLYHVLGGAISPMDGIGPEQLRIQELLTRINNEDIKEIIIATNPNIEGETTAMYLSKIIKPLGIKVSRLAYGIPVGGELDHADEITLFRALEGRREM